MQIEHFILLNGEGKFADGFSHEPSTLCETACHVYLYPFSRISRVQKDCNFWLSPVSTGTYTCISLSIYISIYCYLRYRQRKEEKWSWSRRNMNPERKTRNKCLKYFVRLNNASATSPPSTVTTTTTSAVIITTIRATTTITETVSTMKTLTSIATLKPDLHCKQKNTTRSICLTEVIRRWARFRTNCYLTE